LLLANAVVDPLALVTLAAFVAEAGNAEIVLDELLDPKVVRRVEADIVDFKSVAAIAPGERCTGKGGEADRIDEGSAIRAQRQLGHDLIDIGYRHCQPHQNHAAAPPDPSSGSVPAPDPDRNTRSP
jgi:hypothetical protein